MRGTSSAASYSISELRGCVSVSVDVEDAVPTADWIVDADDSEPGHVTLAVSNINGLPLSKNARWPKIADILNMILVFGDMEDYFAVWDIHHRVHRDLLRTCGTDEHADILATLQSIDAVLLSYERSDQHNINDPARPLYQAIKDIREIIVQHFS